MGGTLSNMYFLTVEQYSINLETLQASNETKADMLTPSRLHLIHFYTACKQLLSSLLIFQGTKLLQFFFGKLSVFFWGGGKKLRLCHNPNFFNSHIFATQQDKPLIF